MTLTTRWAGRPLSSRVIAAPVAFGAAIVLQRFLLQRVVGKNILPIILVTFGLSIIIQNGLLEAYGADTRKVAGGAFETRRRFRSATDQYRRSAAARSSWPRSL